MKNNYNIEHIIESFYKEGQTSFISNEDYTKIKNRIPKNKYKIYKPYKDSNKIILYDKEIPEVILCKIECNSLIKHQIVLKELFNLGLKDDTFGDIIVDNNIAYIYILESLYEYIKYNFTLYNIGINSLDSIPLDYLEDYENKYEEIELLVSSLRIDNIVSRITNDSRKSIIERFKNKEIIKNKEVVTKYTTTLKENDIFSIRRYGKYRFNKIIKNTKKGSLIISISKYI